jgi:hypothetical protein
MQQEITKHLEHIFVEKPWRTRHDACANAPFGFLYPAEGHLLYYLARDYYRGFGVIVDGGSFLGRSARFLGAGIHENPFIDKTRAPFIHCFDNFVVNDESTANAIRSALGRNLVLGDSTRSVFDEATDSVQQWLQVWEGDFHLSLWKERPIEILFVDIAKSPSLNRKLVEMMFPALLPGVSIVIHQDYHHPWLPHIHLTMECLHEYFEIVEPRVDDSIAFLNIRPIPYEMLQVAANIRDTLEYAQQLDLMNRAIARLPEESRHHVALTRAVLVGHARGFEPMQAALDEIDGRYAIPDDDVHWKRYRDGVQQFLEELRNRGNRPAPTRSRVVADDQSTLTSMKVVADVPPVASSPELEESVKSALPLQTTVTLEAKIAALQRELATRNEAIVNARSQLEQLHAKLRRCPGLQNKLAAIESDNASLHRALNDARQQVSLMRRSFSWRLTAPIRVIYRMLGGTTADALHTDR